MEEQTDEYREYWKSRTPQERIAAVEFLRHAQYGEAAANARLQRVLEVSRRGEG